MEELIQNFNQRYLLPIGIPLDSFTYVWSPPDLIMAECDGIVTEYGLYMDGKGPEICTMYGYISKTPPFFKAIAKRIKMEAEIIDLKKQLAELRAENAELRLLPDAPEYLTAKAHFEALK